MFLLFLQNLTEKNHQNVVSSLIFPFQLTTKGSAIIAAPFRYLGRSTMSQTIRLLVIVALFWFAQYIYVPFTTPFLLSQKISADLVGIIIGIYGGMQFVLRFPLGIGADLIGRHKPWIVVGCVCSGTASVIRCLWPNGEGFLVANCLSGVASSMWMSFMLLYTQGLAPDKLQRGMGYILAANNGGIGAAFVCSALLYAHYGMLTLCVLASIAGMAASALCLGLSEQPSTSAPQQSQQKTPTEAQDAATAPAPQASASTSATTTTQQTATPIAKATFAICFAVIKNPVLWFFALICTIQQGILMGTVMSFSNEAAHQVGGNDLQIGMMTVVYITSCVLSCYLSASSWSLKIGPAIPMVLSQLCMALYCGGMMVLTNIYALMALQILIGSTGGFVFAWANTEALQGVAKNCRASALGLFQSIFAFGMTVVPILVGWLIEQAGGDLAIAFVAQAWLAVLGAVLTAAFYIKRRHNKFKKLQTSK